MAGKRELELKAVGQRSISDMLANSRTTVGRSGSRPLPLMEFLNRKSEKRASTQRCVADADLTLNVRERLDASRKNHNRTNKPYERDGSTLGVNNDFQFQRNSRSLQQPEKLSVGESSGSSCEGETPNAREYRRTAQVFAPESSSCMLGHDKTLVSEVFDRSKKKQVQTPPLRLEIFRERYDLDAHPRETASHRYQSRSNVDFIDLTGDRDDAAAESLEDEDHVHGNTEICRKRRRSQAEGALEICPVCNKFFPPRMLQAHVESELDALEMSETKSEPGINFKPRPQSLLVLGDEPKYKRQPYFRSQTNKSSRPTFNHYADGAGWWDEGGVGVDAEAVGSASVWEGRGSMSFGGML